MKYSQIKRGRYHTDFAHDLVAISHNLPGQTLFRKYLELCRETEQELLLEFGVRSSALSDIFFGMKRLDLTMIAKIAQGKWSPKIENSLLERLDIYILKEYSSATLALRNAFELMDSTGRFNENEFLEKTENIMHYAEEKNNFYASPLDRDIFALPIKKLVVTLLD